MKYKKYPFFLRATSLILCASFGITDLSVAAPGGLSFSISSPKATLVQIDPAFGRVEEVHSASAPFIIHIQDAHTNVSAQKNISAILENLIKTQKIKTVFLEGGSKDDSLDALRSLAPRSTRQKVAEKYLHNGSMNGAEYLSLVSDLDFKLQGVEDDRLYKEGLKVYSESAATRQKSLAALNEMVQRAQSLKRKLYPADLLELDETLGKKDEHLTQIFDRLSSAAQKYSLSLLAYPNFLSLQKLKEAESSIDFVKAQNEQTAWLAERVEMGGDAPEIHKLTKSPALDLDVYKGSDLSRYPNLKSYVDYLSAYATVDFSALLGELDHLQDAIYQEALSTEDARALYESDRILSKAQNLLTLQISSADYEAYLTLRKDPRFQMMTILGFLNRELYDLGRDDEILQVDPIIEESLKTAERFYEVASKRDEAFIENIKKYLGAESATKASADSRYKNEPVIFITGGFHTAHLKELFKQNGYAYAVVQPNVHYETNQDRYEKILLSKNTISPPLIEGTPYFEGLKRELSPDLNLVRQSGARLSIVPYSDSLVEGVGESTSDWLKIHIVGSFLLHLEGKPIALRKVLMHAARKFKAFGLEGDDESAEKILERLVSLGLLHKQGSTYALAVRPRLMAVKIDDAEYIRRDFERILKTLDSGSVASRNEFRVAVEEYADVTENWPLDPVESRWPVLRGVSLLSTPNREKLLVALEQANNGLLRRPLADTIRLMLTSKVVDNWIDSHASHLIGRTIYYISPETWLLAGGLGRVGQYHTVKMKELVGDKTDIVTIEPYYPKKLNPKNELVLVDYANLPIPIENLKHETSLDFSIRVQNEDVKVHVYSGNNRFGIKTYFIKDEHEFYTKLLYRYGPEYGSASWQGFTEFFAKASLQLTAYLENRRKKESPKNLFKDAILFANDGQCGLLPLYKRVLYEHEGSVLKNALVWMTTHTYRNRGRYSNAERSTVMKGDVPYEWLGYMDRLSDIDYTSGGLRTADGTNAVSSVHREEVAPIDRNIRLISVTNGDNHQISNEFFRNICLELFGDTADPDAPTIDQVLAIKKEAKRRVSQDPKLMALDPEIKNLNPDQLVLGYYGRLVDEKAGRLRAFTEENIRKLVKAGVQVVHFGNVQATTQHMHNDLRRIAEDVNKEGPGRLIVATGWSTPEQVTMFAATDLQCQDSDRGTGAAEYTESDISVNGGLQVGPVWLEGIIQRQGLVVDRDVPGSGNTLIPANGSAEAYLNTFLWANVLFHKSPRHFGSYQAASVLLSHVFKAKITAAEYLRQFDRLCEVREDPLAVLRNYVSKDPILQQDAHRTIVSEWFRKRLIKFLEAYESSVSLGSTNASVKVFMVKIDGRRFIVSVDGSSRFNPEESAGTLGKGDKHFADFFEHLADEEKVVVFDAANRKLYGNHTKLDLLNNGLPVIVRDPGIQILGLHYSSGARLAEPVKSSNKKILNEIGKNKELQKEVLPQIFRHTDGIGIASTLEFFRREKVLELLNETYDSRKTVTVRDIASTLRQGKVRVNMGYLHGAIRGLEAQGWVRRIGKRATGAMTIEVTEQGREVFGVAESFEKFVDFIPTLKKMDEFLFSNPRDPPAADLLKTAEFSSLCDSAILKSTSLPLIGPLVIGMLTGPLMIEIRKKADRGLIDLRGPFKIKDCGGQTRRLEIAFNFLSRLHWVEINDDTVSFTPRGLYALSKAWSYGVPVSYLPSFELSNLYYLFFAERNFIEKYFDRRGPDKEELLVNRPMNVEGSGNSHETYFRDLRENVIKIFGRRDAALSEAELNEQPKGIADMGCGNGMLLEFIYGVIKNETARGLHLEAHPVRVFGADYNEEARQITHERLVQADISHQVLFGNINDPALYEKNLNELLAPFDAKAQDLLHVRSFLDHNRPFVIPKDRKAAARRRTDSRAIYTHRGRIIPNGVLEQNLYEHFKSWASLSSRFGLLTIDLLSINPQIAARNLGSTLETAYFMSHLYSDQYLIEKENYLRILNEAGFESVDGFQNDYPKKDGMTTVVMGYWRAKSGARLAERPEFQGNGDESSSISKPIYVSDQRSNVSPDHIVRLILKAFDEYQSRYAEITARAQRVFELSLWEEGQKNAKERLNLYRDALTKVIAEIAPLMGDRLRDKKSWEALQKIYSLWLGERPDSDLAIIFFNSIERRIFKDVNTPIEYASEGVIHRYYRVYKDLSPETIARILKDAGFVEAPYENLERDSKLSAEMLEKDIRRYQEEKVFRTIRSIEIWKKIFFRNKGAYLVGRIRTDKKIVPFVIALVKTEKGIAVDAVLTNEADVSNIFGYTRIDFHVTGMNYYHELLDFLHSIIPNKSPSSIYSAVGFAHPAKLELVHNLRNHLETNPGEKFQWATGVKGMALDTFVLPTFGYVFKNARESTSKKSLLQREEGGVNIREFIKRMYRKVQGMDRVGRALNPITLQVLEFKESDFDPALLKELIEHATPQGEREPSNIILKDGKVIFKEVFAQRKLVPLDVFLDNPDVPEEKKTAAVLEWGYCLKDLAAAGIFVMDALPKNFGVTHFGRVVLYDFDDLENLEDMHFLPKITRVSDSEGMSLGEYFSAVSDVDQGVSLDFFPKWFLDYIPMAYRASFVKEHPDIIRYGYWINLQRKIKRGEIPDFFPYPQQRRLRPDNNSSSSVQWTDLDPNRQTAIEEAEKRVEDIYRVISNDQFFPNEVLERSILTLAAVQSDSSLEKVKKYFAQLTMDEEFRSLEPTVQATYVLALAKSGGNFEGVKKIKQELEKISKTDPKTLAIYTWAAVEMGSVKELAQWLDYFIQGYGNHAYLIDHLKAGDAAPAIEAIVKMDCFTWNVFDEAWMDVNASPAYNNIDYKSTFQRQLVFLSFRLLSGLDEINHAHQMLESSEIFRDIQQNSLEKSFLLLALASSEKTERLKAVKGARLASFSESNRSSIESYISSLRDNPKERENAVKDILAHTQGARLILMKGSDLEDYITLLVTAASRRLYVKGRSADDSDDNQNWPRQIVFNFDNEELIRVDNRIDDGFALELTRKIFQALKDKKGFTLNPNAFYAASSVEMALVGNQAKDKISILTLQSNAYQSYVELEPDRRAKYAKIAVDAMAWDGKTASGRRWLLLHTLLLFMHPDYNPEHLMSDLKGVRKTDYLPNAIELLNQYLLGGYRVTEADLKNFLKIPGVLETVKAHEETMQRRLKDSNATEYYEKIIEQYVLGGLINQEHALSVLKTGLIVLAAAHKNSSFYSTDEIKRFEEDQHDKKARWMVNPGIFTKKEKSEIEAFTPWKIDELAKGLDGVSASDLSELMRVLDCKNQKELVTLLIRRDKVRMEKKKYKGQNADLVRPVFFKLMFELSVLQKASDARKVKTTPPQGARLTSLPSSTIYSSWVRASDGKNLIWITLEGKKSGRKIERLLICPISVKPHDNGLLLNFVQANQTDLGALVSDNQQIQADYLFNEKNGTLSINGDSFDILEIEQTKWTYSQVAFEGWRPLPGMESAFTMREELLSVSDSIDTDEEPADHTKILNGKALGDLVIELNNEKAIRDNFRLTADKKGDLLVAPRGKAGNFPTKFVLNVLSGKAYVGDGSPSNPIALEFECVSKGKIKRKVFFSNGFHWDVYQDPESFTEPNRGVRERASNRKAHRAFIALRNAAECAIIGEPFKPGAQERLSAEADYNTEKIFYELHDSSITNPKEKNIFRWPVFRYFAKGRCYLLHPQARLRVVGTNAELEYYSSGPRGMSLKLKASLLQNEQRESAAACFLHYYSLGGNWSSSSVRYGFVEKIVDYKGSVKPSYTEAFRDLERGILDIDSDGSLFLIGKSANDYETYLRQLRKANSDFFIDNRVRYHQGKPVKIPDADLSVNYVQAAKDILRGFVVGSSNADFRFSGMSPEDYALHVQSATKPKQIKIEIEAFKKWAGDLRRFEIEGAPGFLISSEEVQRDLEMGLLQFFEGKLYSVSRTPLAYVELVKDLRKTNKDYYIRFAIDQSVVANPIELLTVPGLSQHILDGDIFVIPNERRDKIILKPGLKTYEEMIEFKKDNQSKTGFTRDKVKGSRLADLAPAELDRRLKVIASTLLTHRPKTQQEILDPANKFEKIREELIRSAGLRGVTNVMRNAPAMATILTVFKTQGLDETDPHLCARVLRLIDPPLKPAEIRASLFGLQYSAQDVLNAVHFFETKKSFIGVAMTPDEIRVIQAKEKLEELVDMEDIKTRQMLKEYFGRIRELKSPARSVKPLSIQNAPFMGDVWVRVGSAVYKIWYKQDSAGIHAYIQDYDKGAFRPTAPSLAFELGKPFRYGFQVSVHNNGNGNCSLNFLAQDASKETTLQWLGPVPESTMRIAAPPAQTVPVASTSRPAFTLAAANEFFIYQIYGYRLFLWRTKDQKFYNLDGFKQAVYKIGRGFDNDIVTDDNPRVSGEHVHLSFINGVWQIRDNASTNGTINQGQKVGNEYRNLIDTPNAARLSEKRNLTLDQTLSELRGLVQSGIVHTITITSQRNPGTKLELKITEPTKKGYEKRLEKFLREEGGQTKFQLNLLSNHAELSVMPLKISGARIAASHKAGAFPKLFPLLTGAFVTLVTLKSAEAVEIRTAPLSEINSNFKLENYPVLESGVADLAEAQRLSSQAKNSIEAQLEDLSIEESKAFVKAVADSISAKVAPGQTGTIPVPMELFLDANGNLKTQKALESLTSILNSSLEFDHVKGRLLELVLYGEASSDQAESIQNRLQKLSQSGVKLSFKPSADLNSLENEKLNVGTLYFPDRAKALQFSSAAPYAEVERGEVDGSSSAFYLLTVIALSKNLDPKSLPELLQKLVDVHFSGNRFRLLEPEKVFNTRLILSILALHTTQVAA